MNRNRRRRTAAEGAKNGSLLMNLSLFIMLLAFFIVLNAISTFEENKVRPIMSSVIVTFSGDAPMQEVMPSITPDPLESLREGATIERIDALFKSQITSYEAQKNESNGVMQIDLPLDVFSSAIMAIGQEDLLNVSPDDQLKGKKFFLPTLVSIMGSDEKGVTYRMDMILHVGDNPAHMQNREPQKLEQVMKRAARLAEKLETAGLGQRLISIGTEKGDESTVTLLFRPHEPFSPVEPE